MADLSWNEIQNRAGEFAARYKGETYEKGESQSFWQDFLDVFGVDRRRQGAFFEYPVKKLSGHQGFIDLFWPGKLLAEQKSAGRDLSAANIQAFDYLHGLEDSDLPQRIVVSDFANFQLINPKTNERTKFKLEQLPKKVKLFGFLIDRESENPQEEDPVNRKAAEAMANLHNQLQDTGYKGHALELLLVRLVFCLFADDAGIFERNSFERYLRQRTNTDGADLGGKIAKIFEVLNTKPKERQSSLDDDLASFPYVNGGLFAESIRIADLTSLMRQELLDACTLDWSEVSPAIFGSMFQGVMDERTRRNLGAHYTSERNILRLIKPLFLDDLTEEFESIKHNKKKLLAFHDKLASLTFLDPACGCGNFLVITYRELRKLEHDVLGAIHGRQSLLTDVTDNIKVNVDQMYGIELEEFPALIAETALWLTDHQMNLVASQQFGRHFARLPLTKRANILNGDALAVPWENMIEPKKLTYILGNPPFVGSKLMDENQRAEVVKQFGGIRGAGVLDFVVAWYAKAADYMRGNRAIQAAFVSTNSISQGEQVGILWGYLLNKGLLLNFAHQTFKWKNEGKGVAAVYCVIEGFSYTAVPLRKIYEYEDINGDATEIVAKNINPYLVDGPSLVLPSRSKPICDVPEIGIGNKPVDGGNYLFTDSEKDTFIAQEPKSQKYFHKWVGSDEFINRYNRWVLWLGDEKPNEIRSMPSVLQQVEKVRNFRLSSKSAPTVNLADRPLHFHVENIPTTSSLIIPKVSSERRAYIPVGMLSPDIFASDLVFLVRDANLYHLGILTSRMHMAWVRYVCGRLKSDYRYSKDIVYNNFPWPDKIAEAQREHVERLAQTVLDTRAEFSGSSLADLYDPLTMPPALMKAHRHLDSYVDSLYSAKTFLDDSARVAFLFKMYAKLTEPKQVTLK